MSRYMALFLIINQNTKYNQSKNKTNHKVECIAVYWEAFKTFSVSFLFLKRVSLKMVQYKY